MAAWTNAGFAQTAPDLASAPATAQPTPAERAERLTKTMTEQLTLTADQSAKIKEINVQRVTELQAFRQKQQSNRETTRQEMQALQDKYAAQYKAILTPEQYAKYAENQARFKGGRNGNHGPGRGLSRPR